MSCYEARHSVRRHAAAMKFTGPIRVKIGFICLGNDAGWLWSEFASYLKYYLIAIYYDLAICMYFDGCFSPSSNTGCRLCERYPDNIGKNENLYI